MNIKRTLSIILSLCMMLTLIPLQSFSAAEVKTEEVGAVVETESTGANIYGLLDNVQYGQILQCWNWSFDNIKANLPKIAAQGFTAVQTSPIQPIKESTKEYYSTVWNSSWVVYQPLAFHIEDNSRNAFEDNAGGIIS
jgi:alpha-amylase